MIKNNPEECEACCCLDMGAVIDNKDCAADVELPFASEAEAQQTLELLVKKAREIESDPCEIESSIVPAEQGVVLKASFNFACQAETLIFQMALR